MTENNEERKDTFTRGHHHAATAPRRVRVEGLGSLRFARFSGVYLWFLLLLVFALWVPDTFLTATTAKSIASNQSITAILAIGLLFPLAAGAYDLSIAQNLGFSAVLAGDLMTKGGLDPALAAVVVLGAGLLIGAVNGLVVAWIKVNSFIATLGMTSVLVALTEIVSNDQFVGPLPNDFQSIVEHAPLGIPIVSLYLLAVAVVAWYVLEHTPLGRYIHATGANADAARLAGVRTPRYVFAMLMVCGGVASTAGLLLSAKLGTVSESVGPPYLLPAFAACFLGTTQLKPGRPNVWGTVLAILLLATGVTGLQLAGGQQWITDLFNGVALVGAVSVAVIAERRRRTATTA